MTEGDGMGGRVVSVENKVVWVTGASSGIGEALVYLLAAEGARLVLSSNEPERLEEVRQRCNAPDRHLALPLDLSDTDAFPGLVEEVLGREGCVDILVNNGGISVRSLARETDLEIDRRVMEIDYFGHVALTKAVLPSMLERRSGHIVVTSSVMGLMPAPYRSAYCAAKHALHGFFDTLRAEVWRENIHVTMICPAAVRTEISVKALTGDGGRFGKMDGVVAAGIPPEACARAMLDAIRKRKREVVVGRGAPRYGPYVKRWFPALFERALRRARSI